MSEVDPGKQELLIDRLARWIARRGLVTPGVFLLEINKPFSFLGSQALWMLQPLMGPLVGRESIAAYAQLLEDPTAIDRLLARLETLRAEGPGFTRTGDAAS